MMVAHIIQAGRAEVVIREDVIESTSDPKPNSFFDSKTSILRVYHGPVYGNPLASLIPAKAEQIGTLISQLNQSASVCSSKSSIDLVKKNNDNIPSAGTEMEKKEIASSSNKNSGSGSGGNDSPLIFPTQRSQLPDLHDEVQDIKYIQKSLGTTSITTPRTIIDDPGHANEIFEESFVSKKDEHNNNDENSIFTNQSEKLQPRPENTNHTNDEWEKSCEYSSMLETEILDTVTSNQSDTGYNYINSSKSRRNKKKK